MTDITVEMRCPTEREMRMPGTTLGDMKKQIEGKTDHDSLDLDHVTSDLLRAAVRDMGIDPDARRVLNAVAQTIANLDGRERIEAPHLAEAINYRMFVR